MLFGFVLLNAQMVGELGRWEYGPTEAIAVKGNTAYISSGSYLWVMDISNESNPRLISEMKLENYIHYIRRIGNYLYVSKNDTLLNIYDIHTDTIPALVNQIEGTNSEYPWYDVYVDGDTVYISGYDNKQYFINDTVNLQYIRRIGFDYQVAVEETVLVATDDNIVVYDLKQTGNINSATDLYLTSEKTRGLDLRIPFIYFGYGSQGIGIMDISNLYDIKLKKTVVTDGNTYDVEVIEDTILIAAKGLNGIGIYDVEDDTVITEIGVCETNGYTYELEIIGDRLYAGARSGGLIIVDISDKSNPVVVGEYRGYGECRRMAIEGDRMYVASGDGGVMIMDITDRENPEVISQCWTRDIGEDVVKGGDYLYVADGDSGLTVVDISDEYNPNVVAGIPTGCYGSFAGIYDNVCMIGGKWRDTSADTIIDGIGLIDITIPTSPIKASELMDGHWLQYFKEVDSLVHCVGIAGPYTRYEIWNVKNPYAPLLVDSLMKNSGSYTGIAATESIAVMNYLDSLRFYDVSTPNNITYVKKIENPSFSYALGIFNNYLISTSPSYRLMIYDLHSFPTVDTISIDTMRYNGFDINTQDEYLFLTHNQYGLSIYGFDMVPPSRITLIEPQDGDTAYNNSMEVTWHKSTDTGVGIDRYEVYVNGIEEGETTDTSITVNTTSTGTRNVWVKVYDRVDNSIYSDTNAVYLLTGIEGKGDKRKETGELTIKATLNRISVYNGTTEKQEIEVLDVMGRVVEKRELKQKEKYELSPKSGIYFIRSGKNKTSKIAVIK
ncbi:MAG: hypothetical protein AB7T10_06845 [bacterium]